MQRFTAHEFGLIASNKLNPETDTLIYDKERIYISCLADTNGCANYAGDLRISNDTIYLRLHNTSGVACSTERIARLQFTIDNPGKKNYHIVKW